MPFMQQMTLNLCNKQYLNCLKNDIKSIHYLTKNYESRFINLQIQLKFYPINNYKMDIRMQYVLSKNLDPYKTPKYYEDGPVKAKATNPQKSSKSSKQKQIKRLTIFDDEIKLHQEVPGPSTYMINPQRLQKLKQCKRKNKQKIPQKSKQTYLDSLLKRSMSLPAVGKYDIQKYQIAKGSKLEKISDKKQVKKFRPTVFDIANRDYLGISPGMYNIQSVSKSPRYSIQPQPKKQKSLPKIPSPQDYNPQPSAYSLFSRKLSLTLDQQLSNKFSSFGGRFKTKIVERSPGPVYNLITNWKKAKDFTVEYNAYKSTSFGPKLSIYHS